MNCRQAESLLVRRLCDARPDRRTAALEAHLETCSGCRSRQEALRSGTSLLAQIEELPSPSGQARHALRRHAAQEQIRPAHPYRMWGARLATASVAGVVLVCAVSFHATRRPVGGPAQAARRETGSVGHPKPPGAQSASRAGTWNSATNSLAPEGIRNGMPEPGGTIFAAGGAGVVVRGQDPVRVGVEPAAPDLEFLDGYDPALVTRWVGGDEESAEIRQVLERRLSRIEIQDDFVEIPFPRLASAAPKSPAVRDAIRKYEDAAKLVDPRLFRKVTLRLKQTPLSDFCRTIQQQTGVPYTASHTVRDENVTLFVKDMPIRDVMRAVARLFGYKWGRSGTEPEYRYELRQDLRAQIAEEELRSRQVSEMLLALDEQLAGFGPYLEMSPSEIQKRLERAQIPEKILLRDLADWNWGAIQVYHRLTPVQRQALATGEALMFRTDARSPELRLPGEWRDLLLPRTELVVGSMGGETWIANSNFFRGPDGPRPTTPLAGHPGAELGVTLQLRGLQEGQLHLDSFMTAYLFNDDGTPAALAGSKGAVLGSTQRPAGTKVKNTVLNAKLRDTEPFRHKVTIEPKATCRWFAPGKRPEEPNGFRTDLGSGNLYLALDGQLRQGEESPHVTTAEVWEAIHDATGTPVVADAYSLLFETSKVEVKGVSKFDALCRLGDEMGVRWQQDSGFLMGRSVTYLWDKLKEVPARHLRRWSEAREKQGFLPLDDVLEASTLSDRQLESESVGHVIGHCWGLEDWIIVGEGATLPIGLTGPRGSRPYARFLALLNPGQRARAQQQGLGFEELLPAQQEALMQLLVKDRRSPRDAVGARFRVDYAPAGTYVWTPYVDTKAEADQLTRTAPFVWGKTAEETLAAARRVYPRTQAEHVKRSRGILALTFANPTTGAAWKAGWIGVGISNRE